MPRQREDARQTGRNNRVILGGSQQSLGAETREGFHRHWFNDEPGRLGLAEQAGYGFVSDASGTDDERVESKRRKLVGRHPDGSPKYAFLMEKPEDWYQEDMKVKQRPLDEFEEQLKRNKVSQGVSASTGDPNYYDKGSSLRR